MKALVGAINQEKALAGAFSVIIQPVVEPMDRFAALVLTSLLTVLSLANGSHLGAIFCAGGSPDILFGNAANLQFAWL